MGKDFVNSAPVVAPDGTIYAGALYLYTFRPDGTLKWKFSDAGYDEYYSVTIGPDGTVYTNSTCDYGCDHALHAITPSGTLKWKMYAPSEATIGADGSSYFVLRDHLVRVATDGSRLWRTRVAGGYYHFAPAIAQGHVYSTAGRFLYSVQQKTGAVNWKFDAGSQIRSYVSVADNGVIHFATQGNLFALNPNGTLRWKLKLPSPVYFSSPANAADGTVYVVLEDASLVAVSASGTIQWTVQTSSKYPSSPVIASDGTVYFGTHDNLYAVSREGSVLWKRKQYVVDLAIIQGALIVTGPGLLTVFQ